ncbi:unnamed protein product [Effrenium voratum]|nr:unnamed protein product [Effrenium voratum]
MEGYVFAENCWDAVICFGHQSIGWGSSMVLLFLLGLTIFIQLVFCYMVFTSFTENPFEESSVTALRFWRIDIAHQVSQVSKNTLVSLAARTCEFDKSLATSFSEKEIAENVFEYGFSAMSTGFIMCCLALVAWFSTIIAEFGKLFSFTLGLMEIPRGHTLFHLEDDQIVLVRLSRKRKTFILTTVLIRAGLQGILLWYGTVYLVYTETVQDLLLNAVALKFVLEVAELMFDAFAPRRSRSFLENLRPLNLELMGKSHTDCLMPVFYLLVLVGLMALSLHFLLMPALEARQSTWEGLCGGNRDFAVATDGLGRLHWSNTDGFDEEGSASNANYLHRATESLISDKNGNPYAPMSLYEPAFDKLLHIVSEETVIEAGSKRNCNDADDDTGTDYWSNMGKGILQMATGNLSISSCKDVVSYCQTVGVQGLRSRQWCPVSCGCGTVFSALLLDKVQNGCPSACTQKSHDSTIECEDSPLNLTQVYAQGAQVLFAQRGYQSAELVALAKLMETQGCEAVARGDVPGKDLCVGASDLMTTVYFRPVKFVCPVACGCDGSGLPGQKRDLTSVSSIESGVKLTGRVRSNSEELGVSPSLCNRGYFMAYTVSKDPTRPPGLAEWHMDCRSDGWKQSLAQTRIEQLGNEADMRVTLSLSSIVQEAIKGSVFDRVNKTLQHGQTELQVKSTLCPAREALQNVFELQGETENGAPMFRSLNGNYLFHGPNCGIGQSGRQWIISPALCSQGYNVAYLTSEDPIPPLSGVWSMSCGRSGWENMDMDFAIVPKIGRLRTPKGFCLESWQGEALLQPCGSDGAQLWILNSTSGHLVDINGNCLQAVSLPAVGQMIGIPVDVDECVGTETQQWEYDELTQQVKLVEVKLGLQSFCLDAAQPDTVGGKVQVFGCHVGNQNQVWTYTEH